MFTKKQLFDIFGYYEKSRFSQVQGEWVYDVRCPHIEPIEFDTQASPPPPSSQIKDFNVRLKEYKLGGKKLGWAGKCEVCSKVYYNYK